MTRKKLYMITVSVLCALTAALLAGSAIRMYVQGAAVWASGDLFYYIYTREKVGAALLPLLPLMAGTLAFIVAGWILGIKDETADKPAALKGFDLKESVKKAVPAAASRRTVILRLVILIAAVVLIVLGVLNGGLDDMFAKGASICTECVGLG